MALRATNLHSIYLCELLCADVEGNFCNVTTQCSQPTSWLGAMVCAIAQLFITTYMQQLTTNHTVCHDVSGHLLLSFGFARPCMCMVYPRFQVIYCLALQCKFRQYTLWELEQSMHMHSLAKPKLKSRANLVLWADTTPDNTADFMLRAALPSLCTPCIGPRH